jgi:hypothetical protein
VEAVEALDDLTSVRERARIRIETGAVGDSAVDGGSERTSPGDSDRLLPREQLGHVTEITPPNPPLPATLMRSGLESARYDHHPLHPYPTRPRRHGST